MTKMLIKVSALACVLGGFAFAGPANAVTLMPANGTNLLVLAAEDTEVEAVEESMRPDVKEPGPSEQEAEPKGEPATPAGEDIGEEEIERDMGKPEEKQ